MVTLVPTVKDVQVALETLGYSRPTDPRAPQTPFVDGIMGPRTRLAISAFQRDHRLYVDGIAGPKTWAKLTEMLARKHEGWLIPDAFTRFAPSALPGTRDALEAAISAYPELASPDVLDDWLGQMWVESKGFSTLVESLNYSVAGLRSTFGRHRISDAECERYGRKPGQPANQRAIANIVYGGEWGRINLGNVLPDDGWEYRGSGFKQITGRRNIEASGFTAQELRTDVRKAALAAADFFIKAGCILPARNNNMSDVTRRINGGLNGYQERITQTVAARKVIRK